LIQHFEQFLSPTREKRELGHVFSQSVMTVELGLSDQGNKKTWSTLTEKQVFDHVTSADFTLCLLRRKVMGVQTEFALSRNKDSMISLKLNALEYDKSS
jgi:hypothetical protein